HCCLSWQQTRSRVVGYKVTVHPSNHQFETAEGQTILDAALSAGYVLPYSCRSGSCSTCKGKVQSGTFDAGQAPAQILSAEDISAGYTLFCQAHATSDMDIEVREVRMASDIQIRKLPARVVTLDTKTDDVMDMSLQLPANGPLGYYAGYYSEFILS